MRLRSERGLGMLVTYICACMLACFIAVWIPFQAGLEGPGGYYLASALLAVVPIVIGLLVIVPAFSFVRYIHARGQEHSRCRRAVFLFVFFPLIAFVNLWFIAGASLFRLGARTQIDQLGGQPYLLRLMTDAEALVQSVGAEHYVQIPKSALPASFLVLGAGVAQVNQTDQGCVIRLPTGHPLRSGWIINLSQGSCGGVEVYPRLYRFW